MSNITVNNEAAACAALVKAQKAFSPALKTSTNPHFKSRYADLSACIEAVLDALNSNGLALMQRTHEDAAGITVETIFIHESGASLSGGKLHVPAAKQDPQGYGSALTYARRYALMSACGIAAEDDDGNAAASAAKPVVGTPVKALPEKIKETTIKEYGNAPESLLERVMVKYKVKTLQELTEEQAQTGLKFIYSEVEKRKKE